MAQAVVVDFEDDLLINVGYNFTGYSELTVYLTKPDGTLVTKTTTDGVTDNGDATAGIIKYPVETGVITSADDGVWLVSAKTQDANGIWSGPTPAEYTVRRRNQWS